jgi:hypothetical protein
VDRTVAAGGLVLGVGARPRPALQLLVAARGRLLIAQQGRPVLLARVQPGGSAVEYCSTGAFRSPLRPVRAAQAATVGSWEHHFASALESSDSGPLHDGRWLLAPAAPRLAGTSAVGSVRERWDGLLLSRRSGEIDWFRRNGGGQVLTLRPVSGPSDARVKACRKQARAGVLAPVLLWWISALDCYVVLDGHDRLAAAIAEEQEPVLMSLARTDGDRVRRETDQVVERFLGVQDQVRLLGDAALESAGRALAGTLADIQTGHDRSWAWPLRGGARAWDDAAREHAPRSWSSSGRVGRLW